MRIGIDARPLVGKRTGIGNYIYYLCQELAILMPNDEFFLYSHKPFEVPVISDKWHVIIEESSFFRKFKPVIWLMTRLPHISKSHNIDIFWGTAHFMPALNKKIEKVLLIYDLTFRLYPKTMGIMHMLSHKMFFRISCERADKVIVISEGTGQKLKKYYNVDSDTVVYPGANLDLTCTLKKEESLEMLKKYNIKGNFFLSVGTLEPRKNFEMLLDVMMSLKNEGKLNGHSLVLAGGDGWKNSKLMNKIEESINAGFLKILGYISNDELKALYSEAKYLVFPSLYEGYGMPVLEARMMGCPVIASDIPEIREAGGNEGIYVKPNFDSFKSVITQAMNENKPAVTIKNNCINTWRASAEKIKMLFNNRNTTL